MAIRLRIIDGHRVALCAAKTKAEPEDLYLDDSMHHALSTKFAIDWDSEGHKTADWADPRIAKLMKKEEGDRGDGLMSKCHPAVKVYFRQIDGKGEALPHCSFCHQPTKVEKKEE